MLSQAFSPPCLRNEVGSMAKIYPIEAEIMSYSGIQRTELPPTPA